MNGVNGEGTFVAVAKGPNQKAQRDVHRPRGNDMNFLPFKPHVPKLTGREAEAFERACWQFSGGSYDEVHRATIALLETIPKDGPEYAEIADFLRKLEEQINEEQINRVPKQGLELFEWSATHSVGYVWVRTLHIRKTKAGTFSVTAREENYDGPSKKVPGRFSLRTARQILDAIIELAVELNMGDECFDLDASDLREMTTVIRQIDSRMAENVAVEINTLPESLWDIY